MIVRTVRVGRNHNTVAWLYDPTISPPDGYSAERRGIDLVRLAVAHMAVRAAFGGGIRVEFRQDCAPYSAEGAVAYPAGWRSVHAPAGTSLRDLERLQDRIVAGVQPNPSDPDSPSHILSEAVEALHLSSDRYALEPGPLSAEPVIYVADMVVAQNRLWVPSPLAGSFPMADVLR